MMSAHGHFMGKALELARQALARKDFPVGCLIVSGETVLASGSRHDSQGPTPNEIDHAEIRALRDLASRACPGRRESLTLYSTMEPCLMCFGAILLAGIDTVVYAYEDAMGGAASLDRTRLSPLYRDRSIAIVPDVRRNESLALFQAFFSNTENTYWKGSLLARYTLAQRLEVQGS